MIKTLLVSCHTHLPHLICSFSSQRASSTVKLLLFCNRGLLKEKNDVCFWFEKLSGPDVCLKPYLLNYAARAIDNSIASIPTESLEHGKSTWLCYLVTSSAIAKFRRNWWSLLLSFIGGFGCVPYCGNETEENLFWVSATQILLSLKVGTEKFWNEVSQRRWRLAWWIRSTKKRDTITVRYS